MVKVSLPAAGTSYRIENTSSAIRVRVRSRALNAQRLIEGGFHHPDARRLPGITPGRPMFSGTARNRA